MAADQERVVTRRAGGGVVGRIAEIVVVVKGLVFGAVDVPDPLAVGVAEAGLLLGHAHERILRADLLGILEGGAPVLAGNGHACVKGQGHIKVHDVLGAAAVGLAGSVELLDGLVEVVVDLLEHLALGGTVQVVGLLAGQAEDDRGLVLAVGPAAAIDLRQVEVRIGAVGQCLRLDVGLVTVGAFRLVDFLEDGVGVADEHVIVVPGITVQVRGVVDETGADGVVLEGRGVALHQVVAEIVPIIEADGAFTVVSLSVGAVLAVHEPSEAVDGHGCRIGRREDGGRGGVAGRGRIQILFRAAEGSENCKAEGYDR